MSVVRKENEKKWINAFAAVVGIISGHLSIRFIAQCGDWFDLEAKIDHFLYLGQGLGILVGLGTFLVILKNKQSAQHLKEVYGELLKVVWPDKDTVLKVTVSIIIGVTILSGLFVGVDFLLQKGLELIY